jgi:signal transduction histidine kinase
MGWSDRTVGEQFQGNGTDIGNPFEGCEWGPSRRAMTMMAERSRALGLAAGEYVEIRVTDTGCGMSPETLRRCFDTHFTTKSSFRGSGLGLPQVDSFARAVGGMVEACSEEGVGTTVAVYLPRVPPAPP